LRARVFDGDKISYRLWAFPLDLEDIRGGISRICLVKCDEWIIINNKNSNVLHITKDGKLKAKHKCNSILENAVLFGSNRLAIRTTKSFEIYKVSIYKLTLLKESSRYLLCFSCWVINILLLKKNVYWLNNFIISTCFFFL
jgi:hypothetical protein